MNATELLSDGMEVTVSCAEGDTGFIYEGMLDFEVQRILLTLCKITGSKL